MIKTSTILPVFLLSAIGLSGCDFDYYLKDEDIVARQRVLFEQLCNAEDRSIIYRTARVNGYLTATRGINSCKSQTDAWEPIVKYGYRYSECTTANVIGDHLPSNADIYKFTIEPKDSPFCGSDDTYFYYYSASMHKEIDGFGWIAYFIEKYQDKLTDKCLVVRKVDEPMSQYMHLKTLSYYDEGGKLFNDEFYAKYQGREKSTKKGIISAEEDKIIDLLTGKILSRNANYTFFPKGRLYSYATSRDCSNGNTTIKPAEVLIPGR